MTFPDGTPVGVGFTARLNGGPAGTPVDNLIPLLPHITFRLSSPAALGYVQQVEVPVPGVPRFGDATVQMRVYDGATWETSLIRGESNIIELQTASEISPPANLVGLQPFQVFPIPEPGTAVLFVGGALGLFWSCRRYRRAKHSVRVHPVESRDALGGSRLQMAAVRDGFLWTCHHVGLDGTDGDYDGGTVDRLGAGWFKMKIKTDNTLSLNRATDGADYGRVYDTASSSPYHYYYPSLAVNSSGDMALVFSGSKSTERIGTFFSGRRASGSVPGLPVLIQAGRDYFNHTRYGDYSHTTPDPSNGSLWTIQQYAEPRDAYWGELDKYGLSVTEIKTNP